MINFNGDDIPVLHYLNDENFVSGEQLSNQLGFSRESVWKQIQKLKKKGYFISTDARKGYRIISRPDILLPQEIYRNLQTKYIGHQVFYYSQVTSTNSIAKENLKSTDVHFLEGAVMIADIQTAGRGRLGRTWHSPFGGIWLTIILFPNLEPAYIPKITLITAVVLLQSIKSLYDIPVHIKWPNDLLIGSKKICGILTEMSTEADHIHYVLVGIGINANVTNEDFPEDIRKQSTSLQEILGKPISRIKLVQILLLNFEKYYDRLKRKQFELILEEWKKNTDILGKNVSISSSGQTISGEAVDITQEGALVIRRKDGKLIHILSGTVQY